MLFTEFYNKLLQLFFMRNFFFILLFFSSHLIFSDEILEIYLDEQHYKLFDYINKKSDLIDKDYDAFIKGFELSIKEIIDLLKKKDTMIKLSAISQPSTIIMILNFTKVLMNFLRKNYNY